MNKKIVKSWLPPIILILFLLSYLVYSSFATPELECINDKGECYQTILLRVIDRDTIKTQDDKSIQFSLASAPKLSEPGGIESKEFIESICPVGSIIIIDEDDNQLNGSYGRITAQVYCNGASLNESLIESNHGTIDSMYCTSEFAQESWARECN